MTSPIVPQKRCPRCKQLFDATKEYFVSSKSETSGLGSYCKNCHKTITAEWRLAHGKRLFRVQLSDELRQCGKCKHILPANREYFSTHKMGKGGLNTICKECAKIKAREYRKNSPDRVKASDRKRNSNPKRKEQQRINGKKNYHLNPNKTEITRKKNINRRARKANAEGFHTVQDEKVQYQKQQGLCWYCGCNLNGKFEVDHIIPLSRGGSNWPTNLVCSCMPCNRSKHDKLPEEWKGRLK